MHVLIYSDRLSFPNGYAATHYVHLIGKGLVEAGANCLLLIPRFTDSVHNPLNQNGKGNVDGIEYEYTTGTPIRPSGFIIRQFVKFRSKALVPIRIIERFLGNKLDVLILYSGSIKEFRRIYFICRLLGIPIILHTTEWQPGFTNYDEEKLKEYTRFYSQALKACDGFIVISKFLKNIIQEKRNKLHLPPQILIVPILVDPGKWSGIIPYKDPRPYFIFCASLIDYLKETLFVLNAFAGTSLQSHDLIIVGKSNEETTKKIMKESERLGVMNEVVLKVDFVDEQQLLALYMGADALLLPLSNDDRSKARFPFKLGDYLMSSRPVVASGVGEINQYLVHRKSAMIAEADNLESFAARMREAIADQKASDVGVRGRNLAVEHFNYKIHGKRMFDFLEETIKRKK